VVLGAVPSPQLVTPPHDADGFLDADHDDEAPLCFHRVTNILRNAKTPGPMENKFQEDLLLACTDEPATLTEAQEQKCWREVMDVEMVAIEGEGPIRRPDRGGSEW
jgi:hypothetical protein